jgi:hypothetical protein
MPSNALFTDYRKDSSVGLAKADGYDGWMPNEQTRVLMRITGLRIVLGGEEHSGWLPPGGAAADASSHGRC